MAFDRLRAMTEFLLFDMLAKTGAEFSRNDSSCVTVSDFPGMTVTVSDSLVPHDGSCVRTVRDHKSGVQSARDDA